MAHIETYKAKVVSPEKETHNNYELFVMGGTFNGGKQFLKIFRDK